MDIKEIDRIEAHMMDILKKREDRVNELNQTISEQTNKKEEAEKGLKEAKDLDSYKTAKEVIRSAADTIEFCNIEIKRLNGRKDVSENDVEQIKTIIAQVQKKANDNFDESAKKIINELQSLVYEYRKINGRIDHSRSLLCNHVALGETTPDIRTCVSWWYSQLNNIVTRLDNAIKYRVM